MFLLADGTKELSVTDNMGSVRLIIIPNGNRQEFDYKPFGGLLYSYTGKNNRENADGSIYDEESELQMMGARMYDDETGRFTSVDPLWAAFPAQSPYSYAYNSPLTWRDPSGLAPEKEKVKEKDKDRLQSIIWDPSLIEAMWAAAMADISMQNCLRGRYSTGQDADGQPMLHGMAICAYYKPPSPGGGGSVMGGSHSGGYGGGRKAEGGSAPNGQGGQVASGNGGTDGEKKVAEAQTDPAYFNLGVSAKEWDAKSTEQQEVLLKEANAHLAELSEGTNNAEWSFSIFKIANPDGTTSVVATNFQTDGYLKSVHVNSDYPCDRPEAVLEFAGAMHTHEDGDFSGADLAFLHNRSGFAVPQNGFLMGVVALDGQRYYLRIIDRVDFGVNFFNSRARLENKSYGETYGSWYDATGSRANAGKWGLDFYDVNNHYGYNKFRKRK